MAAQTSESRKWWGLIGIALGVSMIVVDTTIVNVITPSVIDDLGINSSQAQWIQESYAIVFAALLLLFGLTATDDAEATSEETAATQATAACENGAPERAVRERGAVRLCALWRHLIGRLLRPPARRSRMESPARGEPERVAIESTLRHLSE